MRSDRFAVKELWPKQMLPGSFWATVEPSTMENQLGTFGRR
jgi:hypothetical protein